MEIQFKLRLLIFNVLSTSFTSFPFLNHCQASSVMFNIASIDYRYQRMSETAGLQETTMRKIIKNNNNNNNKLHTPKPEACSQDSYLKSHSFFNLKLTIASKEADSSV